MRFPTRGRIVRSLRRCPLSVLAPPLLPVLSQSSAAKATPFDLKKARAPRTSLWTWALSNGIEKTSADGRVAHLTSINCGTEVKSIVKLSIPPKAIQNARVTKLSQLPAEAMEALGGIILDCKKTPKMLQNEADELSSTLDMRRFPASPEEVRIARRQIMNEMFEENPALMYQWENTKERPILSKEFDKEAQKRLASARYNWKPLKFKDKEASVIFALSRFGGYFAEMRRVLAEFDRNGFVPETVLDFGSGIGAAFWAAFERWEKSLTKIDQSKTWPQQDF
uniref:Methyltransferase-like protein 17, mitochondrial n=1 Tax=Globodera pallida TaxID=36090 RepID=A0A183BJ16_GLOPA